jgi:formate hydrogenlyase subunit 6/NADH:ubiquinone oxidoreductase subunit I
LRLLALAMRREVSTVDWPMEHLVAEGPVCGVPVIDRAACTSCGECVGACPSACLHMPEEGGVPRVDAGPCARCGMCVTVCGEEAVSLSGPQELATYTREGLVMDGSPPEEVELEQAPSRLYRLATTARPEDPVQPGDLLDRRCRSLKIDGKQR